MSERASSSDASDQESIAMSETEGEMDLELLWISSRSLT